LSINPSSILIKSSSSSLLDFLTDGGAIVSSLWSDVLK
jgi:hypothetical protein